MGLNRMMMMKKGQSKQLYHLKSSYVQMEVQDNLITILGFCAEETQDIELGITIPPMGSLSPNEYCGTKIKNILIPINLNEGVGWFGEVAFYGKLPENAVSEYHLLDFTIPQLNVRWVSLTEYDESTNTTSCVTNEREFSFDGIGSLENLYITIAPYVPSDSK